MMAPGQRQPGTELARSIGQKCYHPASSDMLTLSPLSGSGHLFCLGMNYDQRVNLMVVDKQVWVDCETHYQL